jgi:transposase
MANQVFKPYNQNQNLLFPPNLSEMIPEEHPVRLVSTIVDKLDISEILATYKGGGTSSYHPRMLLKVVVFGYLNNIYSSRKIENAIKSNINFMWLAAFEQPDHGTINYFRSSRLKKCIKKIFAEIVLLLVDAGVISLKTQYTDGTKIEATSNKYTFVWKKSVERYKANLEQKIGTILKEIDLVIEEDCTQNNTEAAPVAISSEELGKKIEKINEKIAEKELDKKSKKKLTTKVKALKNKSLPKLQEYEIKLKVLGERNSYSKTDHDATFMRMKDDHMKNGQLKPAYNLQYSTESTFITNYSLHQNPGDTATLEPHLEQFNQLYSRYPKEEVADAGYGSEQNYEYLEQNDICAYVKYNWFHKEQSKKFKQDISRVENLHYNSASDYFVCPMGQKMLPVRKSIRESELGHKSEITHYRAQNCQRCPINGACHKQKWNREIQLNHKLRRYREQARERLKSEKGVKLRKQRCAEVEQVFGQIKSNKEFNRFLLRGLEKVSIEIGLVSIAHNIQKLFKWLQKPENIASFVTFWRNEYQFFIFARNYKKRRPKIVEFDQNRKFDTKFKIKIAA